MKIKNQHTSFNILWQLLSKSSLIYSSKDALHRKILKSTFENYINYRVSDVCFYYITVMSSSRNIMYICLCVHLTFLSAEIKNYFDKTTIHHILIHLFCSRVLILEWAPDKWHQAWSMRQTCRNKITFLQLLPMVCWPKTAWFFFSFVFLGGAN